MDQLQLAYAMTIHKSQGSEYPAVVIVMHSTHYIMLRRNLLYTALTRAEALARLERWKRRWQTTAPIAVAHFVRDIDRMLLFYESPRRLRRRLKTSNPIERFIRELDRKFERVGVFPSARSWERTTYLVYRQLLEHGYRPTQPKSTFTRTS